MAEAPHPALRFCARHKDRAALLAAFTRVRAQTVSLTARLTPEDMQVQPMADASPTKWHLAHTAWFFETFLIAPFKPGATPYHPDFGFLYNSYYEAVGARWRRPDRGLVSRPRLAEVMAYRAFVDEGVAVLIETLDATAWRRFAPLLELGLHHEQQHQELICTDIKALFGLLPSPFAAFDPPPGAAGSAPPAPVYLAFDGGLGEVGATDEGFAFDNERPRHRRYVEAFEIAAAPVTNGDWRAFIEAGGYRDPRLWLSDGWAFIQANAIEAPMHWRMRDGAWVEVTLHGPAPIEDTQPVCHVSYYEAAAFAEWAGARLPTEAELELLATAAPATGALLFAAPGVHPTPLTAEPGAQQVIGGVWEWAQSAYEPYPGFSAPPGAVGEYNGKFMSGQMVLRGGSCATPVDHVRATYRNFFPPGARWQFSGVRLAKRHTGN